MRDILKKSGQAQGASPVNRKGAALVAAALEDRLRDVEILVNLSLHETKLVYQAAAVQRERYHRDLKMRDHVISELEATCHRRRAEKRDAEAHAATWAASSLPPRATLRHSPLPKPHAPAAADESSARPRTAPLPSPVDAALQSSTCSPLLQPMKLTPPEQRRLNDKLYTQAVQKQRQDAMEERELEYEKVRASKRVVTPDVVSEVNARLYYAARGQEKERNERLQKKYVAGAGKKAHLLTKEQVNQQVANVYTKALTDKSARREKLIEKLILSKQPKTMKFDSLADQNETMLRLYSAAKKS
ncbi:hypothetical protein DIPPA_01077 [Diplonema papillatum]|nr:hypothetical protein DIPPA_01077 [Diplonema papillatum]